MNSFLERQRGKKMRMEGEQRNVRKQMRNENWRGGTDFPWYKKIK